MKVKVHKCEHHGVSITREENSPNIMIGHDRDHGLVLVNLNDLKYAMLHFGVDLNCI